MKFKSFDSLPKVRPATAVKNNYSDSLMQREKQTAEQSEKLYNILDYYDKQLEREI